jgi:hypothetical protein
MNEGGVSTPSTPFHEPGSSVSFQEVALTLKQKKGAEDTATLAAQQKQAAS